MRTLAQKHLFAIQSWFRKLKAEFTPLQELQYLGEKLWQLK